MHAELAGDLGDAGLADAGEQLQDGQGPVDGLDAAPCRSRVAASAASLHAASSPCADTSAELLRIADCVPVERNDVDRRTPEARPTSAQPTAGARGDFVLTLSCPDRPGIVHAVTGFLVEHGGNIVESQQFGDRRTGRFFMRVDFAVDRPPRTPTRCAPTSPPVAERFAWTCELWAAAAPYRTLIMVSKFSCTASTTCCSARSTARCRSTIAGRRVQPPRLPSRWCASYGVPFHHVPVTPETKADAEARLLALVDELDVDLVVLARYMQVLSDDLCRALSGRAINIHHSFLPSFKGARPYHQAFDRGVKLVGATAHYVTADLDEGPIIEQDVMRVDHGYDAAEQLVAAGRDVEARCSPAPCAGTPRPASCSTATGPSSSAERATATPTRGRRTMQSDIEIANAAVLRPHQGRGDMN